MSNKNLKIIISVGVSASGKSTWATNFVESNPNYVKIGRDDFRYSLKNVGFCDNKIETMISTLMFNTIDVCLKNKLNVIIDNTNLKLSYINEFINHYKYKVDIEFKRFDITLEEAIERDKNRTRTVGKKVIENQYKQYQELTKGFGFETIIKLKEPHYVEPPYNAHLEDIYVFDIDGTLAHHNNERSPYDWYKVGNDVVDNVVANELRFHYTAGHKIFIVSGRDSVCMLETMMWLDNNKIPYHELYMRPTNDSRKDTIIKREIYENCIKDKYNVKIVYDDRLSVCEMWRTLGLKCFNVEYGDF